MSECSRLQSLLPVPLPSNSAQRSLLVMLRRMAICGLRDARATQLAMSMFGVDFREALGLARCLLHETALISKRSIHIATCCTPRMTRDEALMLDAIVTGDRTAISAVTDNDEPGRAWMAAIALGELVKARC